MWPSEVWCSSWEVTALFTSHPCIILFNALCLSVLFLLVIICRWLCDDVRKEHSLDKSLSTVEISKRTKLALGPPTVLAWWASTKIPTNGWRVFFFCLLTRLKPFNYYSCLKVIAVMAITASSQHTRAKLHFPIWLKSLQTSVTCGWMMFYYITSEKKYFSQSFIETEIQTRIIIII